METKVFEGLEGVVVARTALSDVDGEAGRLVIGGYRLEAIASRSFEWAVALLFDGAAPTEERVREVQRLLAEARVRAADAYAPERGRTRGSVNGMDVLRACVAQLDERATPFDLVGATAVFAARFAAAARGLEAAPPSAARAHAEDVLSMSLGTSTSPSPDEFDARAFQARAKALDTYLVSVIDHGLNASTFATRVVASTGSDLVSAVTAGIGALKGPLHGGAPGPVLDMLDAVANEGDAASWIERELSAGRRIMGMGHRIYRTRDPRAEVLERAIEALGRAGVATDRLSLAKEVEAIATTILRERKADRTIAANVEFYTAVLLEAVGLDRSAFASTFAVGRCAGWCAHYAEQRRTGRLIRPSSIYVGALHV